MSNVKNGDIFMVSRDGTEFQVKNEDTSNLRDTDLFWVQREGVNYSVSADQVNAGGDVGPPELSTVTLVKTTDGARYTDQQFLVSPSYTASGNPPPTIGLKAEVTGALSIAGASDEIVGIDSQSLTVTASPASGWGENGGYTNSILTGISAVFDGVPLKSKIKADGDMQDTSFVMNYNDDSNAFINTAYSPPIVTDSLDVYSGIYSASTSDTGTVTVAFSDGTTSIQNVSGGPSFNMSRLTFPTGGKPVVSVRCDGYYSNYGGASTNGRDGLVFNNEGTILTLASDANLETFKAGDAVKQDNSPLVPVSSAITVVDVVSAWTLLTGETVTAAMYGSSDKLNVLDGDLTNSSNIASPNYGSFYWEVSLASPILMSKSLQVYIQTLDASDDQVQLTVNGRTSSFVNLPNRTSVLMDVPFDSEITFSSLRLDAVAGNGWNAQLYYIVVDGKVLTVDPNFGTLNPSYVFTELTLTNSDGLSDFEVGDVVQGDVVQVVDCQTSTLTPEDYNVSWSALAADAYIRIWALEIGDYITFEVPDGSLVEFAGGRWSSVDCSCNAFSGATADTCNNDVGSVVFGTTPPAQASFQLPAGHKFLKVVATNETQGWYFYGMFSDSSYQNGFNGTNTGFYPVDNSVSITAISESTPSISTDGGTWNVGEVVTGPSKDITATYVSSDPSVPSMTVSDVVGPWSANTGNYVVNTVVNPLLIKPETSAIAGVGDSYFGPSNEKGINASGYSTDTIESQVAIFCDGTTSQCNFESLGAGEYGVEFDLASSPITTSSIRIESNRNNDANPIGVYADGVKIGELPFTNNNNDVQDIAIPAGTIKTLKLLAAFTTGKGTYFSPKRFALSFNPDLSPDWYVGGVANTVLTLADDTDLNQFAAGDEVYANQSYTPVSSAITGVDAFSNTISKDYDQVAFDSSASNGQNYADATSFEAGTRFDIAAVMAKYPDTSVSVSADQIFPSMDTPFRVYSSNTTDGPTSRGGSYNSSEVKTVAEWTDIFDKGETNNKYALCAKYPAGTEGEVVYTYTYDYTESGTLLTLTDDTALKAFRAGDNIYAGGVAPASFAPVIYTGNGGTQDISCGFAPDLVWIKRRDGDDWHNLTDTVRGATNTIYSNDTYAEALAPENVQAFTSDGVTLGNFSGVNASSGTYVAWCWSAGGGPTVTNNNGNRESQVRAGNGLSIATFKAPNSGDGNYTVGHGLDIAPKMVIVKCRNEAFLWSVYLEGVTTNNQMLVLNTPNPIYTREDSIWGGNAPTDSVVWLNSNSASSNADSVMYCFVESPTQSFGSYTGNGLEQGPVIDCGFAPAFVLIKCVDAGEDWYIYDTARQTSSSYPQLHPNSNSPDEYISSRNVKLTDSGFSIIGGDGGINSSSGFKYIYAAFATGGGPSGVVGDITGLDMALSESSGTWEVGQKVTMDEIPPATGTVSSVDESGPTMTLGASDGRWVPGTKVTMDEKEALVATASLVFDANGNVSDVVSNANYVNMNSSSPIITLPSTFGDGSTPDETLPDGTSIRTTVRAWNELGESIKSSNKVTPTTTTKLAKGESRLIDGYTPVVTAHARAVLTEAEEVRENIDRATDNLNTAIANYEEQGKRRSV